MMTARSRAAGLTLGGAADEAGGARRRGNILSLLLMCSCESQFFVSEFTGGPKRKNNRGKLTSKYGYESEWKIAGL